MSAPKQIVLIGIAIGSTNASASFLLPGKGQPTPVEGWPDSEDVKNLLVPIRTRSHPHPVNTSNSANFDWGYSIKYGEDGIQDNILRCDTTEDHLRQGPSTYLDIRKVGEALGSQLDAEIMDELRKNKGLKKYSVDKQYNQLQLMSSFVDAVRGHIGKRLGLAFGNDILQNVEYRTCITVPPWWTPSQQAAFRQGLGANVGLICEATASLVYYLSKNKRHPLEALDTYVHYNMEEDITTMAICNIVEATPELRLNPKECNILMLGAANISNFFCNFVEKELFDYFNGARHDPDGVLAGFEKASLFESYVRKGTYILILATKSNQDLISPKALWKIDGLKDYKFRLPWNIPDSISCNIVGSQMTISCVDLREQVFDPPLQELINSLALLESCAGRVFALLSGILSECPYVLSFIKRSLSNKALDPKIHLLKSVNGATSCSRGAALRLDPNNIKTTVAILPHFDTAQIVPVTQLIIALDLGVTFSAIAYIFTEQSTKHPEVIIDWPGSPGTKVPNTPTLIAYEENNKSAFTWGCKVNKTSKVMIKIEGIKLLLDPDQNIPLYEPAWRSKRELQRLGKSPIDVASDYIGALYQHTLAIIKSAYPKDFINEQQKKFVMTYPAVWSDNAKDLTLRAAKKAGMYPITLVIESEAAALYALHHLKGRVFGVGDAFVLCDAGDKEVNLISYEITSVNPLEFKQLIPGTGSVAGSLLINRRFEDFLKSIIGEIKYLKLKKTEDYADAMKAFDREVKPAFKGDPGQGWNISFTMAELTDDPANNIMSNCLRLKNDVVQRIFEPVIVAICRLVAEQAANVRIKRLTANHPKGKEIMAIFLIGEFGRSPYLKLRLEQANTDIQVIQHPDAWGAVVKGAVLSQMPHEAVIRSIKATKHYGVSVNSRYKESEDAGRERIWDRDQGCYLVKKMNWFINYDDEIPPSFRVEIPCYHELPANFKSADLMFKHEILECNQIDAPKYPTAGVTRPNVTITVDLRSLPRHELEYSRSPSYFAISYNLVVTAKSTSLNFSVEIKGKKWGVIEVELC